ncbi:trypsin-like serine protease, partial [bacterium]|nr:trypsin-like serine protease [bacterium]
MSQRQDIQAIFVVLGLCSALAAAVQADPPTFSPLKQTPDGRIESADTVIMPGLSDPSIPAGPLGRIVTRDLRTGEVTIREEVTREEFLSEYFHPGGEGVLTDPFAEPAAKNFGAWTEIGDPSVGTYPMHVKVNLCWGPPCNEPYGGQCSGTLIDPMHVITAGHCVYSYDEDHPGWAEEVRVIPGLDEGNEPFGHAHAVQIHSWEGWTVDHDHHHDVAILDLDRPIGALTGWRGYGYNDDCDWYYGGGWVHRSYPSEGDFFDGQKMYENAGSFDDCWSDYPLDLHIAYFNNASWGGSSGCGAVRDNVVYAIFRGSDRETISEDCLITDNKFADIGVMRYADMPSSPDIMPIYVQAEGLNFDPGDQLAEFTFVLASYAEQGLNTNVICDIYLSADQNITTGDVWLDDVSVPVNLPAMSAQTVGVWPPPSVPPATTSGRYFLGVILNYADANPGNNITSAVELDSIFVDCPLPGTPVILSPLEGETCQPLARTIDWNDQPLIETYQLRFGTWCGETLIDVGSGSQHTVSGLDNGTTYYATVRAKKYCGSWSPWSDCRSFTTLDIPTSAVAFLTPGVGDICQDSTQVSIAWQPVPGATGYELRVGESCGSGGTYPLPSTTPYHDVTGLDGDTTYFYQVRVKGVCG